MIRLFVFLVAIQAAVCTSTGVVNAQATDESKEPPLRFMLKIGDQSLGLLEGETVKLDTTLTQPDVSITVDQHRLFSFRGVCFKYPRSFIFSANLSDPSVKSWTLDGNDMLIQFLAAHEDLTPNGMAEQMIERVGRGSGRIIDANAKTVFGETTLEGVVMHVSAFEHTLQAEIYRIPSTDGTIRLLVIQDNLDKGGRRSSECMKMLQVLKTSFRVQQ